MQKIFRVQLPSDIAHQKIKSDLDEIVADVSAGTASVDLHRVAKSGGGRLEQIDPHTVEIVIEILNTKAAASGAQAVFAAVMGYLFAKIGTKPDSRDKK